MCPILLCNLTVIAAIPSGLDHQPIATLTTPAPIRALAVSSDRKLVAVACENATVLLIDAATHRVTSELSSETSFINCLSFSADGRFLAAGSGIGEYDLLAQVWDVQARQRVQRLPHRGNVVVLAWVGEKLATASAPGLPMSASEDYSIRVWDVSQATEVGRLAGAPEGVKALVFSSAAQEILGGSRDGNIYHWSAEDYRLLRTDQTHDPIAAMALSPDQRLLASGGRVCKLWQTRPCRLLHELPGHSERICSIDFDERGALIAMGDDLGEVSVWKSEDGRRIDTFKVARRPIHLGFTHDALVTGLLEQIDFRRIASE